MLREGEDCVALTRWWGEEELEKERFEGDEPGRGRGKGTPLFEKGRELLNKNFIIHVSLLQS